MDAQTLKGRLEESFPGAEIAVKDLTGGGDHWQVHIAAPQFSGKNLVQQHQAVYAALGDLMKKEIHALALNTEVL